MPIFDDISKGIKKGLSEAEKGLKEVGEKASDSVHTFEIQQEINKLEDEIKAVKVEIGDKVLELNAKGTSLDTSLIELVSKINGKKTNIAEKKAKIEEIKND